MEKVIINSRFCFKCGCRIDALYPEHHTPELPERGMWKDGIVDKISANYGSKLDGDVYIIAICDNCVQENRERLDYINNYINENNE